MKRFTAGILMALLLGGCTNNAPRQLDASFGQSVTATIEAQTMNPYAAYSESMPVTGMDGEKAAGNLEAYRQDVQKKTEVQNVINIGVGN